MRRWLSWRLLRYALIFLLVAGVPVALYVWYVNARGEKELREAIAALDARGETWTWDELVAQRPADPETREAVDVILKARSFGPNLVLDSFPEQPQVLLSEEQFAALQELLRTREAEVAAGRGIVELPIGRFNFHHDPDPNLTRIQKAREFAALMQYDAYYQAQLGDLDKALHACGAIWRASRALEDELTMIPHLVRIAIEAIALANVERVLAQGQPSPQSLARMQKTLEETDLLKAFRTSLIGERANVDRTCKAIAAGRSLLDSTAGGPGGPSTVQDALPNAYLRISLRQSHAWLLKDLTATIDAFAMPSTQADLEELDKRMATAPPLARMFTPSSAKYRHAFNRSYGKYQCTLAALAVERFRREQGRWPKALDELTPTFLAEAPDEPFAAGKALQYRPTRDGVVIYSVGPEGKFGGTYRDAAQPDPMASSYEFRLWNVPQRRQPPR
jgi:hypothetical protein